MKTLLAFVCVVLLGFSGTAQNLTLTLKDPQPRLGDTVELELDLRPLQRQVMDLMNVQGNFSKRPLESSPYGVFQYQIGVGSKGKHEMEPQKLVVNGVTYTTNAISYEVVDSLPATDYGFWMRYGKSSDSTFWIIIEQRTPNRNNAFYDPNAHDGASLNCDTVHHAYTIPGSYSSTSPEDTRFGKKRAFKDYKVVYQFKIKDKTKRIEFTPENFNGLPKDYIFENIVIQP